MVTAIIQGSVLSFAFSRSIKIAICVIPIIFAWLTVLASYLHGKKNHEEAEPSAAKLTEEKIVFAIIFSAMLLHCCYILLSGIHDRQHDEGGYTGIATAQINPGHLGYIEYIYKFHKLPDMNPYELFSYYHPPLHYVISAVWLTILTALGMPEDLAFENLQILPLFYSGLLMLLAYLILKKIGGRGRGLYAGLFLVAMHPAFTLMSGSVNNDMLSAVLALCGILSTLCFIRERSFKNLILIALSIGFGMLSKLNAAVIAFPVGLVFLLDFISVVRTKDRKRILTSVRNYVIFGITSAVIGLSWIVRNLVRFHENPGVPVPDGFSVLYTGDYSLWARLGIPAFTDWHFEFPFHPLSGAVIHNIWVIMFQTSLFGEEYPAELTKLPLVLCQVAYVAAIVAAIASAVLFIAVQCRKIKKMPLTEKLDAIFLLSGYITLLAGFAAFFLKYPYTCSADFRYIVICLIYIAAGLADGERAYPGVEEAGGAYSVPAGDEAGRVCNAAEGNGADGVHSNADSKGLGRAYSAAAGIVRIGVCATLILVTIIYMTWKRW